MPGCATIGMRGLPGWLTAATRSVSTPGRSGRAGVGDLRVAPRAPEVGPKRLVFEMDRESKGSSTAPAWSVWPEPRSASDWNLRMGGTQMAVISHDGDMMRTLPCPVPPAQRAVISAYAKTGLPEAPRPPRTYYATLSPSLEVKQHQRGRCRPPLASEQSATPTSPANPASDPCGSQLQRRRSGQLRGT